MLPSLFSESAVKLPNEQDRRSPSSEADDTTDGSVSDPIQREGLPEKLQTLKLDTGSSTSGIVTSGADDNGSVPSPEGPSADPNYNKNFLENTDMRINGLNSKTNQFHPQNLREANGPMSGARLIKRVSG